ncbi:MAG: prolyl oligopeptidase family serine peptidase [Myxococcota bacterium]|nr:prolyl oligopeptidase family serine peptidase [Myxococcota bacterium]
MKYSYPPAATSDDGDTFFGEFVPDPYRWLEDGDAEQTLRWADAQDALARGLLAKLPLRDSFIKRLSELLYVDRVFPPVRRGERRFFVRTHADREKQVYYWQGADGEEHVLLDPNTLREDGSIAVGVMVPSWDGNYVAYSLRENAADEATLYVMEVATGATLAEDVLEGAKYASPVWTPDSKSFYYTYLPTDSSIPVDERPGWADIRLHQLGTVQSDDKVIREKLGDPTRFVGVELSRDGRWLFYYVQHGWQSNDLEVLDLQSPEAGWTSFAKSDEAQFQIIAWEGKFYVLTNLGAPNWRVLVCDAGAASLDACQELIPERVDQAIDNAQLIGGHFVLSYLHQASSRVEVRKLDGSLLRELALPGLGTCMGMTGLPEDDEAYYTFESFTEAPQVYKTSIASGESELWAKVELPFSPEPYVVEQLWYPSKDGTQVSLFVVRRKDQAFDGKTPLMLYGYGGFNVSMRPSFRASLYAWLEAGGAYAVANLRGGGEYGEAWHQAGMREKKQNVFDDFIAAAEFLIEKGYTSAERLSIYGGSNGGLLVGAALVQRPELFGGVVCAVPLLDMVRYHLHGSGRTWIAEYGSVEQSEELFRAILAYSPYHHVPEKVVHPPVLFLSADHDDRVDPLHARKMAARLQSASDGSEPVLLRVERNAGHGGADMVKTTIEKLADTYAFLAFATFAEREPSTQPVPNAAQVQ